MPSANGTVQSLPEHVRVCIAGTGFSGIGMAIRLKQDGIHDFVLLERAGDVGGTWRDNSYPGCACDVPSHLYSFSFEPNPDWSRTFSPQPEIWDYLRRTADKYGVTPHVRYRQELLEAAWDADAEVWRIETSNGSLTADILVSGVGGLSEPKLPAIPGIESFEGAAFHSAQWDHDYELEGKRVAVIGTGASAIQLIPAIAPEVREVLVFQRTPIWCLPKLDAPLGGRARAILRRVPGAMLAARWISQVLVELTFVLVAHFAGTFPFLPARGEAEARKLLQDVADPDVRDRLTPRYRLGCKRPSFSNEYIRAFNRDDVHLVTAPIEAITPQGIRTADGVEHEVDVLVLATGFKVFDKGNMPPFPVRGAGALDLAQWWDENRQQAYEGVSVPGFPNWFSILGPYGFNGQSYFGLIETQMRHIVRCLERARRRGATRIEITPEANRRYFESVLARRGNQVFFRGSCANANSYYFDAHGDVPFRPSLSLEAAWRSARFDLDDYAFA